MDERSLNYGTARRESLYSVLATVLNWSPIYVSAPGYDVLSSDQKLGVQVSLEHFRELMIQLAHMSELGGGQINPVHRPVVEQLMADLQAMLDKMPVEEKPELTLKEDILRRQSEVLARKSWVCPAHGDRPWRSKPMVLRGWCHKELADGTECGHELVEKPKPEGMFHNA